MLCPFLVKLQSTCTVKNLLEYQENSPWVIISSILIASGVEQALLLQR